MITQKHVQFLIENTTKQGPAVSLISEINNNRNLVKKHLTICMEIILINILIKLIKLSTTGSKYHEDNQK